MATSIKSNEKSIGFDQRNKARNMFLEYVLTTGKMKLIKNYHRPRNSGAYAKMTLMATRTSLICHIWHSHMKDIP